ncbi:MAG: Holliday junction resolvase RuvX [Pyrinomonadaceae bacterium]|nr:Holliday junction resolvase RuvX [Pyrinomonadaceae bacterium]
MQEKETTKNLIISDVSQIPTKGRLLALDLGTKKVGVAVSDELQFTIRHVGTIARRSWKLFLKEISRFLTEFDAQALIIGLPFNFDGSESEMSAEARRIANNFSLSLDIPVYLQDERVTTYEARGRLWELGLNEKQMREKIDSEAAAIILHDFIELRNQFLRSKKAKVEE